MCRRGLILALGILAAACGCEERSVTVKDGPVEVVRERVGGGSRVSEGDIITIRYRATTEQGDEVLPKQTARFRVGAGTVILGVDEGVRGMREGGERTVRCPPRKHWGRQGHGDKVPPNTTLFIDIELVEVSG